MSDDVRILIEALQKACAAAFDEPDQDEIIDALRAELEKAQKAEAGAAFYAELYQHEAARLRAELEQAQKANSILKSRIARLCAALASASVAMGRVLARRDVDLLGEYTAINNLLDEHSE